MRVVSKFLGSGFGGKLWPWAQCIQPDFVNHAGMLDDYKEDCGEATPMQYSVANLRMGGRWGGG